MYLFYILIVIFLIWCVTDYWKKRRMIQMSEKIPGPFNLPLLGSIYLFLTTNDADLSATTHRLFEKYPELGKFWSFNQLYYMISKPEFIEIILNNPASLEKSHIYEFLYDFLGQGLLTSKVSIWRKHRKIIAPTLNQKILNEYTESMNLQSQILIDLLRKKKRNGMMMDHTILIKNCIADIIGETLFGVPLNVQITNQNYTELIDKIIKFTFVRMLTPHYNFDCIFNLTKTSKLRKKYIEKFVSIVKEIIQMKKDELSTVLEIENKSFLDMIVGKLLKGELSEEEAQDEIITILIAGIDTSATTISFILQILALHPKIQQNVYTEITEILSEKPSLKPEDLPKLKYLERVIKETLRIFPPGPIVPKLASDDIKLSDDVTIPRGANIIMSYFHVHRNEKYWPEPLKFNPDRFLPENSLNRNGYTWLPFSGGVRNCVGLKFGMMVIKVMTALIIREFRVSTTLKSIEEIQIKTTIVLKPKNGFFVELHER